VSDGTALYRIYSDADLLLYIGISNDFGRRWKQHARKQPWWTERRRMTVLFYDSRTEAEVAEEAAVKVEKPKYNKQYLVPLPPRTWKRRPPEVPATPNLRPMTPDERKAVDARLAEVEADVRALVSEISALVDEHVDADAVERWNRVPEMEDA
jgi:predicted GIY-YIG superfamily endonuclease